MAIDVDAALREAMASLQAGRLAAADRACRKILARRREHPDALLLLGLTEHRSGRPAQAIGFLRRAVAARPDSAEMHNNLGALLQQSGDTRDAAACFRRALALAPDRPAVLRNLALALADQGETDAALSALRRAVALDPAFAAARADLAGMLLARGKALAAADRFGDAEAVLQEALRLRPAQAEVSVTLGHVLRDQNDWAGAESVFAAAYAAHPDNLLLRFNLGAVRLTQGRFREGWADLLTGGESFQREPRFPQPRWNGEDLGDGTLLLLADGGLGDAIMFARYVPLVAKRARVVIAGQPLLDRLFGTLDGLSAFHGAPPLPAFDRYYPLGHLPLLFGTDLETIPGGIPYLAADPALVAGWRDRVAALPGIRVGLAWAGNPLYPGDSGRSVALERFAGLADLPGVSLVSLQKGEAAGQAVGFPRLHDWTGEIVDLADTAALITALDLVIAVDTSVAHLAGALGKPVWLLNRVNTDWRWLLGRDDSPWYPTLRQFRQPVLGDWDTPIAAAADALRRAAAGECQGLQMASAPDAVPDGPAEHRS